MSEEATLDEFTDSEVETEPNSAEEDSKYRLGPIAVQFPSDWNIQQMESLYSEKSIGTNERGNGEGRTVPLIKMGDLNIGHLSIENPEVVGNADRLLEEHRLEKDDLLFNTRNTPELVGKTAVWDGRYSAVYDNNLLRVRFKSNVSPRFVNYFLSRGAGWRQLKSRVQGTTSVAAIYDSEFDKIRIPVPEPEEQRKIATVLYTVDQVIQKTEEIINCTGRLRKEVLDELFVSGYGEHDKQQTGYIGPREVEYPSGWTSVELGDLTDKITKGKTPTSYGYNYTDSGINFIKAESISQFGGLKKNKFEHIQEVAHEHLSGSELQHNDVLFSIAGALGKVTQISETVLPANTNQALALIRIDDPRVLPEYIRYYLETTNIQKYIQSIATTTAQSNLNLKQISEFKILVPSVEEQREILKIILDIEEKLENEYNQKETLQRLKQGLMQDLLSGTVRTHETDIDIPEAVLAHG